MCGCKDKKKCGCKTKFVACVGPKGDKGDTGPEGPVGPPGNAGILMAELHPTPSQVKTAYSSPIQIVAAPGAGKAIVVLNAVAQRKYVSTPYTSQGILITQNASGSAQAYTASNTFLSGGEGTPGNSAIVNMPINNGVFVNVNVYENTPLYFQVGVADSAVGDDQISVYITYRIINIV